MSSKQKRLQELRGSDYEIAKGQPDIRGWEVRDSYGHLMGKVRELIFDARANKVRYMVVDVVDSKELQLDKRTVLVPIGLAELEHQDDDVILPNVTPFQLRALPRYSKEDLGTKTERAISTVFGRTDNLGGPAQTDDQELTEDFYDHQHFNEQNMHNRRQGTAAVMAAAAATTPPSVPAYSSNVSEGEAASLRHEAEMRPVADTDRHTPDVANTTTSDVGTDSRNTTQRLVQQPGESLEDFARRVRESGSNRTTY